MRTARRIRMGLCTPKRSSTPPSALHARDMPHFSWHPDFMHDFHALSTTDQEAFMSARDRFVDALKAGRAPDPGLGIHQLAGHPGIYAFRFSQRGRASFQYETDARGPDAHVYWRRVGGHEIYNNP